jgi:hypothetical protein
MNLLEPDMIVILLIVLLLIERNCLSWLTRIDALPAERYGWANPEVG